MPTSCAFSDVVLHPGDIEDPASGCSQMSGSRLKLRSCTLHDGDECSGDHEVCVAHLKQLRERDQVEYENVP